MMKYILYICDMFYFVGGAASGSSGLEQLPFDTVYILYICDMFYIVFILLQ